MLDPHKTYMLESKRVHVRDIIRNPNQYTCKLMTAEDGSECYLEFYSKETKEYLRFSLAEFQPVYKLTHTFIETAKNVEIGERIDERCMMYKEENKNLKRSRQGMEDEPLDLDDDDEDLVFNQHIPERQQFKGNVSHLKKDQINIRYTILKILEDYPEGNTSPGEVRDLLKKQHDMEIPESHVRKTMEELCEPSSERINRKYILRNDYKGSESDHHRKKLKQS